MLKLPETEQSLWRDSYTSSNYLQLSDDLQVDVVVVGAGITGLTCAYLLKKSGLRVVVVEKDTIGGGTTGRTTGKVTSQHNLIYYELQKKLGNKNARNYAQANQAAVEQVVSIIKQEKIDCDFARDDNYVYTTENGQVKKIKEEVRVAASLGLPTTFELAAPLPFEIKGAIKFSNQAKINSQKYLLGLAKAVDGNGSYIFENSKATGIKDGSPGRVKTKKGSVTASSIIVATNVPTLPLAARGGYCILEYPTESYIVAGHLKREMKGMYISPDNGHYSILPVSVGNKKIILIGGEGHISGVRIGTESRYQRLANYAEKHFGVEEITHRWSDRDYLAYDNVPLIGKLYPWSKNLYVATAFKKWGLSNGTVAAMILTDIINGRENKWASTFNSNRLKPITSIPRVAIKYLAGKN